MTTTIFESTPIYPTPSRYWETVSKHKITHFYSAPTAIRLLRRLGAHHVANHDLSSLRILGSVGEPINPEAWLWYNEVVGKNQCAIVDTYWQTETGSIIVAPLPGAIETKPGAATVPFFGIEVAILDPHSGKEIEEPNAEGVLVIKKPWPSLARTVFGDHKRYLDTYMRVRIYGFRSYDKHFTYGIHSSFSHIRDTTLQVIVLLVMKTVTSGLGVVLMVSVRRLSVSLSYISSLYCRRY